MSTTPPAVYAPEGDDELHTTERLARALEATLPPPVLKKPDQRVVRMIELARSGYYFDHTSKLDMPQVRLAADLQEVGLMDLARRVADDEFEPTAAEQAAFAQTPEGKELAAVMEQIKADPELFASINRTFEGLANAQAKGLLPDNDQLLAQAAKLADKHGEGVNLAAEAARSTTHPAHSVAVYREADDVIVFPEGTDDSGVFVDVRRNRQTGEVVRAVWYTRAHRIDITTDEQLLAYVKAVASSALAAEWEAAVWKMLREKNPKAPDGAIGQQIALMRAQRDPETWHTGDVEHCPAVRVDDTEPLVQVHLGDGAVWMQWTPAEVRGHVMQLLDSVLMPPFDLAYFNHLRNDHDVAEGNATASMLYMHDLLFKLRAARGEPYPGLPRFVGDQDEDENAPEDTAGQPGAAPEQAADDAPQPQPE